jgi:hypothetical protein
VGAIADHATAALGARASCQRTARLEQLKQARRHRDGDYVEEDIAACRAAWRVAGRQLQAGDDILPGPDPHGCPGDLQHGHHEEDGAVKSRGSAAKEEDEENGHSEGAARVHARKEGQAGDGPRDRNRGHSGDECSLVAGHEVGLGQA